METIHESQIPNNQTEEHDENHSKMSKNIYERLPRYVLGTKLICST